MMPLTRVPSDRSESRGRSTVRVEEVPDMDERRSSPRRRTFLGAQLKRPGGATISDCIVRDLSKTGARLYVAQPVALPGEIELEITKPGGRFRAGVAGRGR